MVHRWAHASCRRARPSAYLALLSTTPAHSLSSLSLPLLSASLPRSAGLPTPPCPSLSPAATGLLPFSSGDWLAPSALFLSPSLPVFLQRRLAPLNTDRSRAPLPRSLRSVYPDPSPSESDEGSATRATQHRPTRVAPAVSENTTDSENIDRLGEHRPTRAAAARRRRQVTQS